MDPAQALWGSALWGSALWGSALLVLGIVLQCEALRAVSGKGLRDGLPKELLREVICTFQLCCCVREQALLGWEGALTPRLGLTLTFLLSLLHGLTARAVCNPSGSLERYLRGEEAAPQSCLRLCAQFLGAWLSRLAMPCYWLLGLSPLHGPQASHCPRSPLQVALLPGAGVELLCSLGMFCLLRHLPRLPPPFRVQTAALAITGLVWLGGSLTGAVFNPALAYALLFHCEGNTFPEYALVYWAGPVTGMLLSVLLCDTSVPILGRKTQKENIPAGSPKKTN
ncbi:hypothetical protein XENTR_v10007200 [Xenopus tropicalis]|uniref:Aquaporin n=1 Tax=Xenopus tropicalis TaxID=8364 RepID=A0A6I8PWM0_XENTR|nr:aquaporin-11 [Xenopus tropicalis]KAE8627879.1 hypothetical protein XENTR_v10007200 [Xenopus tropicalis]